MEEKEPELPESTEEKETPENSRNFWKILQLFGAYLVGAWTLVQFLDWLLNRYQISPYWTDISLWIFTGIIPSLLIYLVHQERITQQGLRKREKLVIVLNILLLSILVIFSYAGKDLGSIAKNISYTDQEGRVISKNIIKSKFRIPLTIFPFEQEGEADTSRWMGNALGVCLSIDMDQDKYLTSYYLDGKGMIEKINAARLAGSKFYIDGSFRILKAGYEISPALRATRNGKILEERVFRGDNFFALVDSISIYLRQSVGIKPSQMDESIDLNTDDFITDNLEALKYFNEGVTDNNLLSFEKAIKLDTTFALAMASYATNLYIHSRGQLEAEALLDRAMRHRKKLPFYNQILIMAANHLVRQEFEKAEKLINIQLELDPNDLKFNYFLAYLYYNSRQFEEFTATIKKLSERSSTPNHYIEVIHLELINGNAKQVEKDLLTMLKEFPNNVRLLDLLIDAYMLQQKYEPAQGTLEELILMNPDIEPFYARMQDAIAYLKDHPVPKELFAQLEGVYRSDRNEKKMNLELINNSILYSTPNTDKYFLYPASGSSLIRSTSSFVNEYKPLINDSNRFYGILLEQANSKGRTNKFYYWKQDSLIWRAEELLKNRAYEQALPAYETAIAANPEHYYLYKAKEHVEYMLSKPDTVIQQLYQRYAGDFEGGRHLWIEEGQLWYKRPALSRRILRPISDENFIDYFIEYNGIYSIDIENGEVKGLYGFEYDKDTREWLRVKNWYQARVKLKD